MWKIASVFWLLVGLGVSDGRFWAITTKTAWNYNAGSDANVYLHMLNPDAKNSPALHLDNFAWNDFVRGARNVFVINTVEFDDVCFIRIYRDSYGDSPGLLLLWVAVRSSHMRYNLIFEINDWIPTEEQEKKNNFVVRRTPPCSPRLLL